ncbi:MAG TPA: hypothetical protein VFN91_04530 [Myxococcaceae bacterium]|nr:hypothetical protein [Myxococcaceae bacterium]
MRRLRLPVLVLAVLAVRPALAYVPAPGAIFRHLLTGRDEQRVSTARVEGMLVLAGGASSEAGGQGELQSDARVYLKLPGRCRLEASGPETGKLAVVQAGGQVKNEGPAVTALGVGIGEVCALFGARSAGDGRAELEAHLRKRGVNVGSSWLARFGGQVAYVVGGSKDTDPQFWVFKDSWLPARIRWTDGGTRWDVRFVDYNSPAGDWFPRVVEVSRDGERQARFTTLSGDPRANVPDRLF